MNHVNWDEVKENLSKKQGVLLEVSEVKQERSFLLKALVFMFGLVFFMMMCILSWQLMTNAPNTDKTIDVLKLLINAATPIVGLIIGFYFGKNQGKS